MITVKKDNQITQVLEVHLNKYLEGGWVQIDNIPTVPINDDAKMIAENLNKNFAATTRKEAPINDNTMRANAIVGTELRKESNTKINDGLIKDE